MIFFITSKTLFSFKGKSGSAIETYRDTETQRHRDAEAHIAHKDTETHRAHRAHRAHRQRE